MGFRWFYIFGVTEGLSALCRKGLVCVAVRERAATKESMRSSPHRATVHRTVAFDWFESYL